MEVQTLCAEDCLNQTIEKYAELVYRLAFSQLKNQSDAEDVLQEVFLRYLRKQPAFESEEHGKAWFIRVTVNRCRSVWSSAWRRHHAELDESLAAEDPDYLDLRAAVCALPKKYRAVIHLFYYEDYTTAKIAALLRLKESTVRAQLTRARAMLRERLKGDWDGF